MNLKLKIIQNSINWNNSSRQGRNKQAVIAMKPEQINQLKKISIKDLLKSGLKLKFGTGNNSFDLSKLKITFKKDKEGKDTSEILSVIGSELGIPTPTSPSLRFLTCRESSDLQKKDPKKNTSKRLKNKSGPLAGLWLVNNYNCEMKTDGFQFGIYQDVTTDHLISQRKLIIGYMLGIINKNNYQDRNNMRLMRGKKNVKKGSKSFYERTKNTSYSLQQSQDKLDKFLRSNIGQYLLAVRKKTGAWHNLLVKIALWYHGHELCDTTLFQQKNKVNFVLSMIKEYHQDLLEGCYIDPYAEVIDYKLIK